MFLGVHVYVDEQRQTPHFIILSFVHTGTVECYVFIIFHFLFFPMILPLNDAAAIFYMHNFFIIAITLIIKFTRAIDINVSILFS